MGIPQIIMIVLLSGLIFNDCRIVFESLKKGKLVENWKNIVSSAVAYFAYIMLLWWGGFWN
jgi:hypothetical protein